MFKSPSVTVSVSFFALHTVKCLDVGSVMSRIYVVSFFFSHLGQSCFSVQACLQFAMWLLGLQESHQARTRGRSCSNIVSLMGCENACPEMYTETTSPVSVKLLVFCVHL